MLRSLYQKLPTSLTQKAFMYANQIILNPNLLHARLVAFVHTICININCQL